MEEKKAFQKKQWMVIASPFGSINKSMSEMFSKHIIIKGWHLMEKATLRQKKKFVEIKKRGFSIELSF